MKVSKKYVCEECESEVTDSQKFCGSCGSKLLVDAKTSDSVKDAEEADTDIDNEEDFKEYAEKVLKEAFGEDYDEDEAEEFIEDLIEKVKDGKMSWGEAVGVVQSSLGDDVSEIEIKGKGKRLQKMLTNSLENSAGMDAVGLSVPKVKAEQVKSMIKELDPKAKISTFIPVTKRNKGFVVKTTKEKELKQKAKKMGVVLVPERKLQEAPNRSLTASAEEPTDSMKWTDVKSYSMSSKKGGGMQLTFVMKDGRKHSVDVDKKDAEKWSQLSAKEKAKMAEKYHEMAAEKVDGSDSVQDAGFKNKKARSVVEILKGAPGMTDEKARALLMYHGNLTSLQRARSSRDVLRFKALKEMLSEDEVDGLLNYLKDRKKKKKEKNY